MSAIRRPAVVDASGSVSAPRVTTTSTPVRMERFTGSSTNDDGGLPEQLTRSTQNQSDSSLESRGDPLRGPTVYKGLTVNGTDKVIVRHGLGRRAFWWVVGWYGASTAAAHDLVSDESDATGVVTDVNTLALRGTVAGTVDVAVA